ncbi:MAG: hypothetical protein RJQ09_12635 [Cyclobacteriaceae bacterium]
MRKIVPLLFAFVIATTSASLAQVGDVSKGAKGNKEKTRKSSDSDGDYRGGGGSGVFLFLEIFDVVNLMVSGQKDQLAQRFDQPYRVSLEASLSGGYDNSEGTYLFLPSFRGNWGLFSTALRSNRMQDRTGQFQTLDWQVIQFNFVNLPKFTMRFGQGFSYVQDIDDVYHESTVGFEVHLKERRMNPSLEFRWSNDYSTDVVPRFEVNPSIDFQLMQSGKFKIHAMAGYLFQRYIGEQAGDHVPFHFIQTGLNLYFY